MRLGVYTSCRTIDRWSVVDMDAHLDRLSLISGLDPSKSASTHGLHYFAVSKPTPDSRAVILPSTLSSGNPSSESIADKPVHDTDGNRGDEHKFLLPWRLSRDVMRSVTHPIIQRLLKSFDQLDGGQMAELRLTLLIAHRWNESAKEKRWKGLDLLQAASICKGRSLQSHNNHSNTAGEASESSTSQNSSIAHESHHHAPDHRCPISREEKKQLDRQLFLELYDVWVFGEYLPEVPAPPIFVDLMSAERHNPTVKHVDWANDRKKLQLEGTEGANEMVLMDSRGNIAEGLSSNFLAVVRKDPRFPPIGELNSTMNSQRGGTFVDEELEDMFVLTAPNHAVLSGTIRHLMLQCAEECGIPVLYEFPTRAQLEKGQWLACAIMSTSRLLLPVTQINIIDPKSSESNDVNGIKADTNHASAPASSNLGPLTSSIELLAPLHVSLLPTSSHQITQSYRFHADHPLLLKLIAAIKAKMRESSANLKT